MAGPAGSARCVGQVEQVPALGFVELEGAGGASSMRTRRVSLSGRDVEVLTLIAGGLTNREIVSGIFLSEATDT